MSDNHSIAGLASMKSQAVEDTRREVGDGCISNHNGPLNRTTSDKTVRARALALGYVQRLALKKIALGKRRRVELFGVGSKTLGKLTDIGLLERSLHESGESIYQLTQSGQEVFWALDQLGWFPP